MVHIETCIDKPCDRILRIGVVGYSDESKITDLSTAKRLVANGLFGAQNELQRMYGRCDEFAIVSGLTNLGIPKLAYEYCSHKHLKLEFVQSVGIACAKATHYPRFPVDDEYIIGEEWGDESQFFIDYIDCLVRVGGGTQSHKEVEMFKTKYPNKILIEFDL